MFGGIICWAVVALAGRVVECSHDVVGWGVAQTDAGESNLEPSRDVVEEVEREFPSCLRVSLVSYFRHARA